MNTYNKCNCGCLQSNKDNLYKDVNKIAQKGTAPKKKKTEKQMFKSVSSTPKKKNKKKSSY